MRSLLTGLLVLSVVTGGVRVASARCDTEGADAAAVNQSLRAAVK